MKKKDQREAARKRWAAAPHDYSTAEGRMEYINWRLAARDWRGAAAVFLWAEPLNRHKVWMDFAEFEADCGVHTMSGMERHALDILEQSRAIAAKGMVPVTLNWKGGFSVYGATEPHDYTPTPRDREFARQVVRVHRHGGVFGDPATGILYRIDHNSRTMTLLNPERLADAIAAEHHARTVAVFATAGYRVE